MDDSQNNDAEWKKPDKRVYVAWLHLHKYLGDASEFLVTENTSAVALGWGGQEAGTTNGQEETFGSDEYVYYLHGSDGFTDVYVCVCVKTY